MDWTGIKHFDRDEFRPPNDGDEFEMGMGFLLKLDMLREHVGSAINIHRNGGYARSGHSKNSLHYQGLAADVHIGEEGTGNPRVALEQAILAHKWTFLSIGIYPYWNQPGLHLDDRSVIGLPKVVWYRDRQGEYNYYPYDCFHQLVRDFVLMG